MHKLKFQFKTRLIHFIYFMCYFTYFMCFGIELYSNPLGPLRLL